MVALRSLVETTELAITVVSGDGQLETEVSGAHASEQPDPTPWLSGGELLMSDGLGLRPSRRAQTEYIERLARRQVAGFVLGLGGELPYASVPAGLVDAAQQFGVPLLTVPVTTPFIAITQAFYSRVADERSAMSDRILRAHARLTSAAASGSPVADIAAALGRAIDGWAEVYDATGAVIGHQPFTPSEMAVAIERYAPQLLRSGLRSTVAESGSPGAFVIQPLGVDRVRGYLAYGRDSGALGEQFTHEVATYASALLSIETERRHSLHVAERRPGAEVLRRLLSGSAGGRVDQLLMSVGFTAERVQVLLVEPSQIDDELADGIDAAVPGALVLTGGGAIKALLPAEPGVGERLRGLCGSSFAGLGGPVRPQHFPASRRQADHAVAESRRRGGGLVDAMRLGDVQVLLQLVSAGDLSTYADAVLGPIERAPNGPSLLMSLNAFLVSGTAVEEGSHRANVHRHTMRRHLRRIEDLTARNLKDARDRNELWLAFQARDVAATL
jgi:PucR family transcriptional regulator, purine catabolism regulatory protein